MLPQNNLENGEPDGYQSLTDLNRLSLCPTSGRISTPIATAEDLFSMGTMKKKQGSQSKSNFLFLGLWAILLVAIAALLIQASYTSVEDREESAIQPAEKPSFIL